MFASIDRSKFYAKFNVYLMDEAGRVANLAPIYSPIMEEFAHATYVCI
jgi:hypothetical protein